MATSTLHLLLSLLLIFAALSSSCTAHLHRRRFSSNFLGKFSRLHKSSQNVQQYQYDTRYFRQRLDHFSFADLPSFQQKYLINTHNWLGPSKKAPIFFYCGNEGNIEWFAENTGFVWEIAPRFGAMVVFPEVTVISGILNVFAFCIHVSKFDSNLKIENCCS